MPSIYTIRARELAKIIPTLKVAPGGISLEGECEDIEKAAAMLCIDSSGDDDDMPPHAILAKCDQWKLEAIAIFCGIDSIQGKLQGLTSLCMPYNISTQVRQVLDILGIEYQFGTYKDGSYIQPLVEKVVPNIWRNYVLHYMDGRCAPWKKNLIILPQRRFKQLEKLISIATPKKASNKQDVLVVDINEYQAMDLALALGIGMYLKFTPHMCKTLISGSKKHVRCFKKAAKEII